ncbi:DUF4350 domain-containing protein [Sediminibacillus halophilus]|uniref:DUF4350 domain-containing protein n=1 Tax=Sediminibacillus halophilus TaxID=482461 RepID=A0A1G9UG00_9BACI|nr:DUF4350 domain-containing protein [Sediminibacillus halophilus]SDM58465.1 protein of unknown function [Sediminibacillus halophilus]
MQKRSYRKTWLTLAVFLLLFVGLSYVMQGQQPEEYPAYLSTSPSPTGTKAFFTYLENERGTAGRWSASPERLPSEKDGSMLMMIEPSFMPDQKEMAAYQDFVEAGNMLFLWMDNPDGLFNLQTRQQMADPAGTTTLNAQDGEEYQAELSSVFRLQEQDTDEVLLEDEAGVIALKRKLGDGELIVAVTPEWTMNRLITEKDHAALLTKLLDDAPTNEDSSLLFDEYVHAGKNAAGVTKLYPQWLLVLVVQAVFGTILWLWYRGKRFGPIDIPREEAVRFSDEQIQAVAAWYQRGRYYRDSLIAQADYVQQLLLERRGIVINGDWKVAADKLSSRARYLPAYEIQEYTEGLAEVVEKPSISKQEYLLWSKRLDRLREEVEHR